MHGQVAIKNDNLHQITFTEGQTKADDHSLTLSISDISQLSAYSMPGELHRVDAGTKDFDSQTNFYFADSVNDISVGNLSAADLADNVYFPVTFQNSTSDAIGRVQLSFDFISNLYGFDEDFTLSLKYRVNDSDFRHSDTGIIRADMLRNDKDEWNTFSMQLSLSDLYLRPGDTVDFIWMIEQDTEKPVPVGLNRIDSHISYHEPSGLTSGSLVITEILPPFEMDEKLVEYLEIYNPGDYPLPIKGLEVRTSNGEFIIQDEIYIEPFGVYLIGNTDIFEQSLTSKSSRYSKTLLSESGGRVELIKNGETISRAAYEASEPGTSLELDHVLNANDGYAGLRNFTASTHQIDDKWRGTPGQLGSTVPMYKHHLQKGGWHFFTAPGMLIEKLNRHQQVHFFDFEMNMKPVADIRPHEAVLLYKELDDPSYIHIEQAAETDQTPPALRVDDDSKMIHIPTHKETSLGAVTDELGNRLTPAALLWNHETGSFDLVHDLTEPIRGWQPIIVNQTLPETVTVSAPEELSVNNNEMDRFIEFHLREENESVQSDRAMIGFLNEENSENEHRYHLPKLFTDFDLNSDFVEPSHSFIYLASQISEHSANSFMHLPKQLEQSYEVRLGYYLNNNGVRATIGWTLTDEIPDEWVLELTDTQTGDVIDMREQSRHTFNSVRDEREFIKEGDFVIQSIHADGSERFVVNIKPYESIVEEEEETVPESVELRPNYPNPFNPATNIVYYLPESQPIKLSVYNVVGQQVSVLVEDTMRAGEHTAIWNASDMPSGIYIVQLETGNRMFTRKITLIK